MFGEVVICQFPFTSGTGSKIRPALVLFDLAQDAMILPSHLRAAHRPTRHHPSRLASRRAAKTLHRPNRPSRDCGKTIFLRRLGVLSAADLAAVRNAWNSGMKL